MKRKVLFIDKHELIEQFNKNSRQDIKIITPSILTEKLATKLIQRGKKVKKEIHLRGDHWTHSSSNEPNNICESLDFTHDSLMTPDSKGPVSISFANIDSVEDFHYHKAHWEIYYSEYKLISKYRLPENSQILTKTLSDGGVILFTPGVIHKMEIHGLTIVIESPSVIGDRISSEKTIL